MKKNILNKVRNLAKAVLPFYLFTLLPLFYACSSDDHTGSIDVSGSCLVEKFVLNGQYEGVISHEKRLIKVKVPVDFTQTGDMEVTSLMVSAGATTSMKVGDHLNFNADRTLTVLNGDLQMNYQVAVRNDEAILLPAYPN